VRISHSPCFVVCSHTTTRWFQTVGSSVCGVQGQPAEAAAQSDFVLLCEIHRCSMAQLLAYSSSLNLSVGCCAAYPAYPVASPAATGCRQPRSSDRGSLCLYATRPNSLGHVMWSLQRPAIVARQVPGTPVSDTCSVIAEQLVHCYPVPFLVVQVSGLCAAACTFQKHVSGPTSNKLVRPFAAKLRSRRTFLLPGPSLSCCCSFWAGR
jgi:hypothetical protein